MHMKILDLFRPKWKRSDPEMRKQGLREIALQQQLVLDFMLEKENAFLLEFAIEYLIDPEYVIKFLESTQSALPSYRINSLLNRVKDQAHLDLLVLNEKIDLKIRKKVISRIKSPEVLKKLLSVADFKFWVERRLEEVYIETLVEQNDPALFWNVWIEKKCDAIKIVECIGPEKALMEINSNALDLDQKESLINYAMDDDARAKLIQQQVPWNIKLLAIRRLLNKKENKDKYSEVLEQYPIGTCKECNKKGPNSSKATVRKHLIDDWESDDGRGSRDEYELIFTCNQCHREVNKKITLFYSYPNERIEQLDKEINDYF